MKANGMRGWLWLVWIIAGLLIASATGRATAEEYDTPAFVEEAMPGKISVIHVKGDYVINAPGAVKENMRIELTGSVVIAADDVTLKNFSVKCLAPDRHVTHGKDGIRAVGVNRLKLRNVSITGCGQNGVFIQGGEGHDFAEGKITEVDGAGVVFDNVAHSALIGWYLRGGVHLQNQSHHNLVISVLVQGNRVGPPFWISSDSYANQIVRSRSRDCAKDASTVLSGNPDNLWHHVICDNTSGYAGCYFLRDKQVNATQTADKQCVGHDYGNSDGFSPRTWTVCNPATFGSRCSCDFETYDEAVSRTMNPSFKNGDIVVIDTNTTASRTLPPITIDQPFWLIGDIMGQKGQFGYKVYVGDGQGTGVTVNVPGVRLQNLYVNPSISVQEDTDLINIRVKVNEARWEMVE
jgi:hypothetical protein